MPPVSRRQRKYDEQLRRVQNRNIFAGLLLLIALAAAVWLVVHLWPSPIPTLHVFTNHVDYAGTRTIPFAEKSCDAVSNAFATHLQCDNSTRAHQIDSQNSLLELSSGEDIASRDILVVYFNGHIKQSTDQINGVNQVNWIGPEAGKTNDHSIVERDLKSLFQQIDKSPGAIKLVLLDAGRYCWSPAYPGRSENSFAALLEKTMQDNEWGLSQEFWVITSHDDNELSHVSTPLKRSLFAEAITDSLASINEKGQPEKLSVVDLFKEIQKRTSSYARNFKFDSLQHPVLLKTNIGVVSSQLQNSDTEMKLNWLSPDKNSESGEADKPKAAPRFLASEFITSGNVDRFSQSLLDSNLLSAQPGMATFYLEQFIELGIATSFTGDDQYRSQMEDSRVARGANFAYDEAALSAKQEKLESFRRELFQLATLARFRHQMRLWDDVSYEEVVALGQQMPQSFEMTDSVIEDAKVIPNEVADFTSRTQSFFERHADLIGRISQELGRHKDKPLTPLQAELLYTAAKRYLPLLAPAVDADAAEPKKADSLPEEFSLDLGFAEQTSPFNPTDQSEELGSLAGMESVIETAKSETIGWQWRQRADAPSEQKQISDTSYRFDLAARGSEFFSPRAGVLPNIRWDRIEPVMTIAANPSYRVNPQERVPISLSVNTQAVGRIEIQIDTKSREQLPDDFQFGFDLDFSQKKLLTLGGGDNGASGGSEQFDVYFYLPEAADKFVGQEYAFSITARDIDGNAKDHVNSFSIELTEDHTLELIARRKLADQWRSESRVRLYRWGNPPDAQWNPLVLNTLANVKSEFEFKLVGNSALAKSFKVKLLNIANFQRLPFDVQRLKLRADRADPQQAAELILWITDQDKLPGKESVLIQDTRFQPLAIAEEVVSVENAQAYDWSSDTINFLPPPRDPASEIAPDQPITTEIENGMLMVFYPINQEKGSAKSERSDQPAWYQWVIFQPQEPANAAVVKRGRLATLPDLKDVFGDDLFQLPGQVLKDVSTETAISLTTVTKAALRSNQHLDANTLSLQQVLNQDGQTAAPRAPDKPAFLLLDLLGVPGYGLFETAGSSIKSTRLQRQLTGVRIRQLPQGWQCHPRTWSFVSQDRMESPFQWLAKRQAKDAAQMIYLRIPTVKDPVADQQNQTLSLEFFLPVEADVLSAEPADFWRRWSGGVSPLIYPNARSHFIESLEGKFSFWSQVGRHGLKVNNVAGRTLEIGRLSDRNNPLGRWTFVTESPKDVPRISISNEKVFRTTSDFQQTKTKVNLSEIRPAIDVDNVRLKVDGKWLNDSKQFLTDHRGDDDGEFEFSLYDLWLALDKPDLNGSTSIDVETTDFFGHVETARALFKVSPKPKVKKKPVIKPVELTLKFTTEDGTPADLRSFESISINGTVVPWNNPNRTKIGEGLVKAVRKYSEGNVIYVSGLAPGTYSVSVSAMVLPEGAAEFVLGNTTKEGIEIKEDMVVTLPFK